MYKGKLSRSCRRVNRFAGKEQASSRTGKVYDNSKQDTASSIHSKQFLYKNNFKGSNFNSPVLRGLQWRETALSIDETCKPVPKRALITSFIKFILKSLVILVM